MRSAGVGPRLPAAITKAAVLAELLALVPPVKPRPSLPEGVCAAPPLLVAPTGPSWAVVSL